MKKAFTQIFGAVGVICTPLAFAQTIGHPAAVVGNSMEPTLKGGDGRWWKNDIVWISKIYTRPKKDDIFCFTPPHDPTKRHMKRVGTEPRGVIKLKNGAVSMLSDYEYWMLADNPAGIDSRTYGPVNHGLLRGKAKCIIWPLNRMRKL